MISKYKVRILRETIRNLELAISKHGPVEGYVRSLAFSETVLVSYLNGETDENGQPLR